MQRIYSEYEGTLLNPSNGKKIHHDDTELSLFKEPTPLNEADIDDEKEALETSDNDDDFDIEEPHVAFIDTTIGWLTIATKSLEDLAARKSLTSEQAQELVTFLINWVTGDPTNYIPQQAYLQYGTEYWRKVLEDEKQKKFAQFILPFLALPASEAVCERAFWYQRRVIGDQGMSTGETTEINKINYLLQRKK